MKKRIPNLAYKQGLLFEKPKNLISLKKGRKLNGVSKTRKSVRKGIQNKKY